MRIGVLGPLQVDIDGRQVRLGGPLPRRLLAALVSRRGEVVSVDALCRAVWGEVPPSSATKSLQSYVARLRAGLDTGGPSVIVTAASGYRLVVAAEAVDAEVFVGLVRRAERAVEQARPQEAEGLLAEAFLLWRGPAYGQFADTEFGAAEAVRLEEFRLRGMQTRLEAWLLTGRHGEVIAEAQRLCAEHPLRERFWQLLITGLYRGGRQAEALEALRRVRTRLVDELGTDPGPALRLLEQQVLRHDPGLDRADAGPQWPAGPPERLTVSADNASDEAQKDAVPAERRVGTVVVAGIAPLPDRSGWSDPEVADTLTARFHDAAVDVVTQAGGILIERMGTDVVAAFGLHQARDDHAARAMHALLALRALYTSVPGEAALHSGVATGELLCRAGETGRLTVSGEPVRLATGLRHAAADGQILVAERTVAAAQPWYEFADLVPSGGSPPVRTAAVLLAARSKPLPRSAYRLTGAFIGRDDDLHILVAAYRRTAAEGRPYLVTVLGEAGIGKSTLLQRFVKQLTDEGGTSPVPLIRTGRCLAYGKGITYSPMGQILLAQLGFGDAATVEQIRQSLAGEEILGVTLGLDIAEGVDPRDAPERLAGAWVRLLDEMVAACPVVLVLEDVHWAEKPLLDLIGHLTANVGGPLLIIATARPEYAEKDPATLDARPNRPVVWLERLSDEDVDLMLRKILGGPASVALRTVLMPAEGNPFFIEELLAMLVDRGLLVACGTGWSLVDGLAAQHSLPDTIRSTLAARIGCLDAVARSSLQVAAVAGRVFSAGAVATLMSPTRPELGELMDRDFVRRQPSKSQSADPAFIFKHALTQQVAYDSLPTGRRARLHAAFADHLASGDSLDEQAPMLAHHYFQAARPDLADLAWADDPEGLSHVRQAAVTWLHRAGELATRQYDLENALPLLHQALELADDPRNRANLWRAISQTHLLRFDYPTFQSAIKNALEASDDPQQQAETYVKMIQAVISWGVIATALPADRTVEDWIERALALAEPGSKAHSIALSARAIWYPERLTELAPQALAAAEASGDINAIGEAYGMQEALAALQRRYADVLGWGLKRLARIDLSDPHRVGGAYLHPMGALTGLGRFAEARHYAALNEQVAARQTIAMQVKAIAWWIELEAMAAEWQQVRHLEDRFNQATQGEAARATVYNIRALLLCAAAHAHLGDPDESQALERRGTELAGASYDDRIAAPYIRLALARSDLNRVDDLITRAPTRLRPWAQWWSIDLDATRLDALAALDDKAAVEAEAAPILGAHTFTDAVATRALGTVYHDRTLLLQAVHKFTTMDLPAHATQALRLAHKIPH